MASHVFISHGSENADQADELVAYLEARGLKIWIAPRDIWPGTDYSEQLQEAIETCAGLIVLVTDKSNKSPYVRAETEMAFSIGKPIFPVRLCDIQPAVGLALFLKIRHWTDAYGAKTSENLHRLAQELQLLGTGPPRNPTAAPPGTPPLHIVPRQEVSLEKVRMHGMSRRPVVIAVAGFALLAVLAMLLYFESNRPPGETRSVQRNSSGDANQGAAVERFECEGPWMESWSVVPAGFVPPEGLPTNRVRVSPDGVLFWNKMPVSESNARAYLNLTTIMESQPLLILEQDQQAPCRVVNRMMSMANQIVNCTPALCRIQAAAN